MKQCRQNIYEDIIREAEEKKRAEIKDIEQFICPGCKNKGKNCFELSLMLETNNLVYRCKKYKKK